MSTNIKNTLTQPLSTKHILILVLTVVLLVLVTHHKSSAPCIMLTNGTKLCGSDAGAWCRSTDGTRSLASNYANNVQGAGSVASELQQSSQDCQSIESQY